MQKFKSTLIIILMFFIVYFLQLNFFSWFNIAGIKPNLFIPLVLFVGLYVGKKIGILYGMCLGLILDITIGRTIGENVILLGIVGYVGEVYDRNFSKSKKISIIILNVLCLTIFETIEYAILCLGFKANVEISLFIEKLILENLYNILIIIIFFEPMKNLGSYIEKNFKDRLFLT